MPYHLLLLLSIVATATLQISGTPTAAFCRIESCAGCRLNSLPKVRQFVYEGVKRFPAVKVKFIPGKSPVLLCYDADETLLATQDIAALDEAGIADLLADYGITPDTPAFIPVISPTAECVAWRQTGACNPAGAREPESDLHCSKVVEQGLSGYCECANGVRVDFTCDHGEFTCQSKCVEKEL
eukprot:EG_transcript_32371